jgi:magnesium transporter
MESRDWINLPFELQCLDAVLGSVCAILGKDAGEIRTKSITAMEGLLNKGSGQGEEILRHMKNSIKEMSSRVQGFIRAMNLVLDETEDMALMNLSRLLTHPERFIQPVPEEILNEGKKRLFYDLLHCAMP